ncbi:RND family transporter [Immundisolibacter sp.]|uniref:efflux RND transporter permease subunit n=1 Tax=Immundisolibacter sp. TaxID=1934948 RepID=UPI00356ADD94
MSTSTSKYAAAMASASSWLADQLIRWRVVLLVVLSLITLFLGYHASFLKMDPGFTKSIPLGHPYMQTYTKYTDQFGGANVIIVALMQKEGDIFNVEFFNTLEKATQDVLFIKGADRSSVTSLFTPNVDFVLVDEEGFVGHRVVEPDFKPTQEEIEKVRNNLLVSQHVGRLVSHDFRGALIRAELVDNDPNTGQPLDYTEVAKALEDIRERYSSPNVDVRIIGFAKFIDDVIQGALGVVLFFVVAVVITFIMLYFYSNSFQITTLAILVAITAVIWQLGLVKILGYGIDPLSILVPFLILAIGVSHAIQMTNTWKLEILNGADSVTAARESFNKLFIPGTTALLANAVGFAVIMIIDIDIIQELGITASIGVGVMIATNKFMLPVLLSYASMNPRTVERIRTRILVQEKPFFRFLASFADRKKGSVVIALSVVLLAFGSWKWQSLVIGDSEAGAPEFWPEAVYNQDIETIITNFLVGIDELTVIAEMPRDGCTTYSVMKNMDRFVWHVEGVEGVQSVVALSSVMKDRNVGNNEGHIKFYGLPRTEAGLGSAMRNIELNQKLFNDTCEAIPIRIFLWDHKAPTLQRVVAAVRSFKGEEGAPISFRLASGPAGVMAATNEAVSRAEAVMMAALFVAVGILCYLTFLSWRASLCILLPLALVSILANAVMVMLNIGLKVSTLPVVALGVGVGVDYGIYLFARTQANIRLGLSLKEAYYQGLKQAGTAVIFTASTMSIGVATWFFSDLKFQSDMGVLLAYMFFVNMVGAVLLLPALAAWFIDVDKERLSTRGMAH